jgi:hypothetical protein
VVARGWQMIGLGALLALGSGAAQAENLDAGKSAAALFTSTCSACHSSPKGLARNRSSGLASYLQEHYTSSPQSAALLAAYLLANPGSPQGKQAPTTGHAAARSESKKGEAKSEQPEHPPQTATARPDSMIEPTEPRRPDAKGRGKRQQTKQETLAPPPASSAEPAAAQPSAPPSAPTAAPVAAAPPPPDQPAFSAPSP